MEVIVTNVSKLAYNLFRGLITTYIGVIIKLLSTIDIQVYLIYLPTYDHKFKPNVKVNMPTHGMTNRRERSL